MKEPRVALFFAESLKHFAKIVLGKCPCSPVHAARSTQSLLIGIDGVYQTFGLTLVNSHNSKGIS